MRQLKLSELIDEQTVCPYCMNPAAGIGCCGESSAHFERAYITKTECLLESEVEVMDDIPAKEIELTHKGDDLRLVFNSSSELLQAFVWVHSIGKDVDITAEVAALLKTECYLGNKIEVELFELARK